MDQKDWVRVIDHSNYFCRSWQNLYFEPRVVQFIKIVGTSNTVNKVTFCNLYCIVWSLNNEIRITISDVRVSSKERV